MRNRIILSAAVVIVIAISLSIAATHRRPSRQLPLFGQLPAFRLTNEQGTTTSNHDLIGHVWIAGFMFTNCEGQCPTLSANMKTIQSAMQGIESFRLVSFTVDPKRDTPEVLRRYAKRFEAVTGRWLFLTGPQGEIQFLSQHGFRLAAGRSDNESIAHSFRLVLLDKQAQIRGYYDGLAPEDIDRLIQDAKQL